MRVPCDVEIGVKCRGQWSVVEVPNNGTLLILPLIGVTIPIYGTKYACVSNGDRTI